MDIKFILSAWQRLIVGYLSAFSMALLLGMLLTNYFNVDAKILFKISTKRIAHAHPVLEWGTSTGLDQSIVLFIWNSLSVCATLSFIFTASWFNPNQSHQFPRPIRSFFCTRTRMKLLCYFPGCIKIEAESLRRLYLWLRVPLYGIILLGVENGLSISTAAEIFGSLPMGVVSLLPHGIIEIPAICAAGAVPYSAHLILREKRSSKEIEEAFHTMEAYRNTLALKKIVSLVIFALLIAGIVEAHVTLKIITNLTS